MLHNINDMAIEDMISLYCMKSRATKNLWKAAARLCCMVLLNRMCYSKHKDHKLIITLTSQRIDNIIHETISKEEQTRKKKKEYDPTTIESYKETFRNFSNHKSLARPNMYKFLDQT